MPKKDDIEDAEVIDKPNPADTQGSEPGGGGSGPDPKTENVTSGDQLGDNIDIQWGDNDFAETLMNQKTSQSSAAIDEAMGTGPSADGEEQLTPEELDAYMKGEYDDDGLMSIEDLMVTAEFVIEFLDAANSSGVSWFSGEKASQFELEKSKKKTLTTLLAKVFYKYQVKLGPVATLIFAAILYFGMTWKAGWDIKKEKKEEAIRVENEKRKELQRKKLEAYRNRIMATIGVSSMSLKDIAEKMGQDQKSIKQHVEVLLNQGLLWADHSKQFVQYQAAA